MNAQYILSPEKACDIEVLLNHTPSSVKSMLIYGEPGSGKTSFAKHFAESINAHFIFGPCYDGITSEQLLYNWDLGLLVDAMTNDDTKGRDALKDGYLLQALKQSQHGKCVLLLDEIDKAKPGVDTMLLTYMQECMYNDPIQGVVKGNPDNLFIIATSNQRRELDDALDRRFTLIREFKFPDKEELMQQISCYDYNETKVEFIIRGILKYRLQGNAQRKPSQNQISDLFKELSIIHSMKISRNLGKKLKVRALHYKLSQFADDHKIINQVFESFGKNWKSLI